MQIRKVLVGLMAAALLSAGAEAGPRTGKRKPDLVQRVYAVADLVVPVEMDMEPGRKPDEKTKEKELIELVRAMIAPESWSGKGGEGSVQYFPLGMGLVIRQTQERHAEIAELLTALRRLQDVEVVVELRMITVCDAGLERIGRCNGIDVASLHAGKPAILAAEQVRHCLDKAQTCPNTNIMQMPKITAFNGQRVCISIADEILSEKFDEPEYCGSPVKKDWVGVKCFVRPVATADRQAVNVSMNFEARAMEKAGVAPAAARIVVMKLDRVLKSVPHGHSALMYAGKTVDEVRQEFNSPLGKIPYLGRLFRNVGYSREVRHTLVLLTPRIIVNTEAEQDVSKAAANEQAYRNPVTPWPTECLNAPSARLFADLVQEIAPGAKVVASQQSNALVLTGEATAEQHVRKITQVAHKLWPSSDLVNAIQVTEPDVGEGSGLQKPDTRPLPAAPSPEEILRALPRPGSVPYLLEVSRDDVELTYEKLLDKVDPPRFYPLVGRARLHRLHWKCTVSFTETVEAHYPLPFRYQRRRQEVVYFDKDRLHRCAQEDTATPGQVLRLLGDATGDGSVILP